jgi:hypothetical protein
VAQPEVDDKMSNIPDMQDSQKRPRRRGSQNFALIFTCLHPKETGQAQPYPPIISGATEYPM